MSVVSSGIALFGVVTIDEALDFPGALRFLEGGDDDFAARCFVCCFFGDGVTGLVRLEVVGVAAAVVDVVLSLLLSSLQATDSAAGEDPI